MPDNLHDTGFLLQNLMEHMTDNIYFKDRQSRFIMVNRAFCEWTGLDCGAVVGKTDFDLFASEHAQQAYADEQRIIETGQPLIGIEEKETWEDGHITWVSTTKMPLKNSDGETIGTFGVSRNITDHKEAELKANYYSEQIRRIKEEMEEDVRMAGELQKTFFPRHYPCFPEGVAPGQSGVGFFHHYHASGLVSGDFCTVRRLSESESGIFLCDVMGHGVRAALGTALICAMVEEISGEAQNPGDFLARMNELLLPIMRQEDMFLYATACYAVFDARSGLLRIANAGHPIPLHSRGGEGGVGWLFGDESVRGPALAIAEGAEYETFDIQLGVGDSVVMYTDGLYEVEDASGEEFGEQRLLAAAQRLAGQSLEALFPALVAEASAYAGGKLDDDVCLVGLHYRKPMQ
ncbi:Phosphoserine phosphatase RsbU [Pontiella desulfatans]|uniref:Phosphoserine phosphatase RsbU n=1 Tax=Pontiella desulfatans TaxID=2750659 RepID=A0A6C2UB79_PONDE|nr:SpoIIE family protein phosphatase [Pontiella desulfatans]VGO17350.1 Phosphoserine phosphatase RsbU [Pontiella desulfatans]